MNVRRPGFDRVMWVFLAICIMNLVLGTTRYALEVFTPTYSGMPTWTPIQQVPIFVAISVVFAVAVELLAVCLRWGKIERVRGLLVFGGTCGALSINIVIWRLAGTHSELLVLTTVVIAAIFARHFFAAREIELSPPVNRKAHL